MELGVRVLQVQVQVKGNGKSVQTLTLERRLYWHREHQGPLGHPFQRQVVGPGRRQAMRETFEGSWTPFGCGDWAILTVPLRSAVTKGAEGNTVRY